MTRPFSESPIRKELLVYPINPINMRTLFTLIMIFGCTLHLQAQDTVKKGRFGIGVGTNMASINASPNDFSNDYPLSRSALGNTVSVFHETSLRHRFSVQCGAQFTRSIVGSPWYDYSDPSLSVPLKVHTQFRSLELGVPITLRYIFPCKRENALFTTISLSPVFLMDRNWFAVSKSGNRRSVTKQEKDARAVYRTRNVAVGAGIGYDFRVFKKSAFVRYFVDYQLHNSYKNTEVAGFLTYDSHWLTMHFTVGTYFGGTKTNPKSQ
jgi:hypothetical protein